MAHLTILNWNSRRATEPMKDAIERFGETNADCVIDQTIRPLSDFEHQSIDDVARKYDLVVFDHPFCGTIARTRCFEPLDEHLPDLLGESAEALYLGPSLSSYRFGGHIWGAPVDGATQNALYRKDLMNDLGAQVPVTYEDVLALGQLAKEHGRYLGTAIQSPHALMSIMTYMANSGSPIEADDTSIVRISRDSFECAYNAVNAIAEYAPVEAFEWNSIDLHEAMVVRDDIVYAPLVYGYATYGEADYGRRLGFADLAGLSAPYHAGTTIGGTALGLSSSSKNKKLALEFIRFVLSEEQQAQRFGLFHGQPAMTAGWGIGQMDEAFNGYFSGVRKSMETAWIRPRFDGYPVFQELAGRAMADALQSKSDASAAYAQLCEIAGIAER